MAVPEPKTFEEFAEQWALGGNWTKKDLKWLWKTAFAAGVLKGKKGAATSDKKGGK